MNPSERENNPSYTGKKYYGPFFGRVEQRIDPARLGRVRVRVYNLHSKNIQTQDLPWAMPSSSAWVKGGFFGVPPLNETVKIEFIQGDPDYPIWTGGHWGFMPKDFSREERLQGTTEAPDGNSFSRHKFFPTSMFGGKPNNGLLKPEQIPSVKTEDAPDNYGFLSPHNKHWEFDDRQGRQKVKLSDQLDNFLWINSEHASLTMEARTGLQGGTNPFGFTANADPLVQSWQAFSHQGYQVTGDALEEMIELAAPGLWKVLLDRKRKRIEIWTEKGHHLIMSDGMTQEDMTRLSEKAQEAIEAIKEREDANEPTLIKGLRGISSELRCSEGAAGSSFIGLFTQGGRQFVLADNLGGYSLNYMLSPCGSYLLMDSVSKTVDLYSAGRLKLKAADEISIGSKNERVTIDGKTIHLNGGFLDADPVMDAIQGLKDTPWFDNPRNARRVIRACDYPYFLHPEKIPGYS